MNRPKTFTKKTQPRLALGLLLGVTSLGLAANCKTLNSRIEIQAPPAQVMAQLHDTQNYQDWNPFLQVHGKFAHGNQLKVRILHEGEWMEFEPTVIRSEPNHIVWRGRLLMPGIFTGEHGFRVVSHGQDKVVFEHYENFSGILVPFFDFNSTEQKFNEMNRALKKRVETSQ